MTGSPSSKPYTRAHKTLDTKIASQPSRASDRHRAPEHLISGPLHTETCTRCGHPTIRALVDGIDTTCNPQPLTPTQELAALHAGQPTYNVITAGNHYELVHRDNRRIRAAHPEPVVTRHHCQPDGRHHTAHSTVLRRHQAAELADTPPF